MEATDRHLLHLEVLAKVHLGEPVAHGAHIIAAVHSVAIAQLAPIVAPPAWRAVPW